MKLKIMPIGDSMTRGSYLAHYETGLFAGQPIGLPNPAGGGWRKTLQDKLRVAGVAFEFAGELEYGAFGQDGILDPNFDPRHHGLAGFGNLGILEGGIVPTPKDVLTALGVNEISVPDIVTVLSKHKPDLILLMSGANGFNSETRERLIFAILENFVGQLLVAAIPPQCPPRQGFEKGGEYNASLPATVAKLKAAGRKISMVDMSAVLTTEDLLPDGVHPNKRGMEKMAEVWFQGLRNVGFVVKKE